MDTFRVAESCPVATEDVVLLGTALLGVVGHQHPSIAPGADAGIDDLPGVPAAVGATVGRVRVVGGARVSGCVERRLSLTA